jgi:hypothetical protein
MTRKLYNYSRTDRQAQAESSSYASAFLPLSDVRLVRRKAIEAMHSYLRSLQYLRDCKYRGRAPAPEYLWRHELAEARARDLCWVFSARWVVLPSGEILLASPEAARLFGDVVKITRARIPGGPKHRIPRSRDVVRASVPLRPEIA